MIQVEHGSQLDHHGITKMCTMIYDNRFGYAKLSDYVIEQK